MSRTDFFILPALGHFEQQKLPKIQKVEKSTLPPSTFFFQKSIRMCLLMNFVNILTENSIWKISFLAKKILNFFSEILSSLETYLPPTTYFKIDKISACTKSLQLHLSEGKKIIKKAQKIKFLFCPHWATFVAWLPENHPRAHTHTHKESGLCFGDKEVRPIIIMF